MSLAFLAKKSWHTTNVKNVEKVWIAEQQAEKEKRRVVELQKQIEEERQIQELRQLQVASGQRVNNNDSSLDWMYQGPAGIEAQQKQQATEEYLLGKVFKPNENQQTDLHKLGSQAGALWLNKVNSKNDSFTRLHEDPLLSIRKREKETQDSILNNPMKMARIRLKITEQLEIEERQKAMKKAAKKASKSEKKESKKEFKKRSKHENKTYMKNDESDDERSQDRGSNKNKKRLRSKSPQDRNLVKLETNDNTIQNRSDKLLSTGYGLVGKARGEAIDYPKKRESSTLGPNPNLVAKREEKEKQEQLLKQKARENHSNQLSQEEKLKRLTAMENDAKEYDSLRYKQSQKINLQAQQKENDSRHLGSQSQNQSDPRFLNKMRSEVYTSSSQTMEDRLRQNRHYTQKNHDMETSGFLKRPN